MKFSLASAVVVLAAASRTADAQYPNVCPGQSSYSQYNATACPSGWTCSPNGFSVSQWGCCPFPDAVACPSGYQCCPQGTTCNLISGTGYSAVYSCQAAGAQVTTSLCPCKPGPALPLSSTVRCVV
jgi:hypothetical protein